MPDHLTPYVAPFVVLVDTAESNPWTFKDFHCDSDKQYRPLVVRTERVNLGRHPNSQGDYSLKGYVGRVAIERKSAEDLYGTILGWNTEYETERDLAGHRERFEQELDNLSKIRFTVVVVESTKPDLLESAPSWGVKSSTLNAKILWRSIISYQQRWPNVQWEFASCRRMAETYSLDYLRRFYRIARQLELMRRKVVI